jgi:hypothetical protein
MGHRAVLPHVDEPFSCDYHNYTLEARVTIPEAPYSALAAFVPRASLPVGSLVPVFAVRARAQLRLRLWLSKGSYNHACVDFNPVVAGATLRCFDWHATDQKGTGLPGHRRGCFAFRLLLSHFDVFWRILGRSRGLAEQTLEAVGDLIHSRPRQIRPMTDLAVDTVQQQVQRDLSALDDDAIAPNSRFA